MSKILKTFDSLGYRNSNAKKVRTLLSEIEEKNPLPCGIELIEYTNGVGFFIKLVDMSMVQIYVGDEILVTNRDGVTKTSITTTLALDLRGSKPLPKSMFFTIGRKLREQDMQIEEKTL